MLCYNIMGYLENGNLLKKSSQSAEVLIDTIMSVERIIVMDIKIAVCDDEVEICSFIGDDVD